MRARVVVMTLLVVVVGLPLAALGAFLLWWHQLSTPPDVAATARSAEVDRAAVRAVGIVDPRLPAVVGAAPWLRPVSAGFEDVCRSEAGSFIASGYGPVTCTRTATRILAADDAARNEEWDRALRGAGWTAENELQNPPGQMRYVDPAGVQLSVTWSQRPTNPVPSRYRDPETEFYRAEQAVEATDQGSRYLVVVTASLKYYDATPSAGAVIRSSG